MTVRDTTRLADRGQQPQGRASVTLYDVIRVALPTATVVRGNTARLAVPVTWARAIRGRAVDLGSIETGELVIIPPPTVVLLGGEPAIERLMRDLEETGPSGFVLLQEPSDSLAATAMRTGMPLVVLPETTSFAEAERAVVDFVLQPDEQFRRKVDAVYDRLLESLIEESGAALIVGRVAEVTRKSTYLFDPFLQVLAASSDAAELEVPELRQRLAGMSRTRAQRTMVDLAPGEPQSAATGLVHRLELRGTEAGFLCLVGSAEHFGELDERLAERAASVLVIELAKQRAIAEARIRMQSDFLDDLLEGAFATPEAMANRARVMGYDLAQTHLVFTLEVVDGEEGARSLRTRQRFVDAARQELLRTDPTALVRERDGRVIVVKAARGGKSTAYQDVDALVARLRSMVDGPTSITAGVGSPCEGVTDFPKAYREALMAAEVARVLKESNACVRFEDLGVERVLFQLVGNPELSAFRRDMIGQLEEYDRRHGSELARTLEVFLASHGNHVKAARELHLHRNTLLYRLERAQTILGRDLDNADTRLSLQLALKLRHLPEGVNLDSPAGTRHNPPR